MKVSPLDIPDIILFEPKKFEDCRGFFFESFNQKIFEETTGHTEIFVQDNHSSSQKNVLRGMHYQLPPKAQGKLVRVIHGEVFDVAVDIRKSSPTFGQWVGKKLSADNKHQLWIPEGFAHGFITLSETAEFLYKTTNYYAPELDRCIAWDDSSIAINWPIDNEPQLSFKDKEGLILQQAEVFQ